MTHLRFSGSSRRQAAGRRPRRRHRRDDSPPLLIWKGERNLDNKIQFSELALLEFDPSDGKLRYYEVNYPASWTDAQKDGRRHAGLDDDEIYDRDPADPIDCSRRPIRPDSDHAMVSPGISGAEFHKYDSSLDDAPAAGIPAELQLGSHARPSTARLRSARPCTRHQRSDDNRTRATIFAAACGIALMLVVAVVALASVLGLVMLSTATWPTAPARTRAADVGEYLARAASTWRCTTSSTPTARRTQCRRLLGRHRRAIAIALRVQGPST
jgi:hypothetical protein